MSQAINSEVTRKVAHLARLELTDDEVTAFTQQLGKVVEHVAAIASVSTDGIEPLYHPVDMAMHLREDVVKEFPRGHVLKSAPEVLYDGYKVPSIL
jgi:aspartyl-tRNA(Asn)/glutamyl-tRNA(Gln) amidotransferase subunit C